MIIVAPIRPTVRPSGGGALQDGDIWVSTLTGVRERRENDAWAAFAPVIIYATTAPAVRPAANGGGALQFNDTWVHQTSGAQAYWDGTAWVAIEPIAGAVPLGGRPGEHLAKAATRPYDTQWVDPADGIAFLHEQRLAAQEWRVLHELRSRYVAVTVVDNTRDPPVTMIPDIYYSENQCELRFASAVSGFALIHASKPTSDVIIQ